MLVSKATLSACLVASVLVSPAVATAGKLAELRERTGAEPSADDGDDDDDDDDKAASSHRSSQGSNGSYEKYTRRAQHEPSRTSAYFFLEYPYANWDRGILVRKRLPADAILASCVPEDPECVTREHVAACIDGYCYGSTRTASWGGSRLQSTRTQIYGDVGQDTDGLGRGTLGLFSESNLGIVFDTRWTYWAERHDALWLGDANLGYALLRLPSLQLTPELGVRALIGNAKAAGVNASLAAELYPIRPLVLRSEVDAGTLGRALFWEAQASAGVAILRLEIYAGIARLRVEDLSFDSAFAGLRLQI